MTQKLSALGCVFLLLAFVPAPAAAFDRAESARSRCLAKINREAQYVERRLALLEMRARERQSQSPSAENLQPTRVSVPVSQVSVAYIGESINSGPSAATMFIQVLSESGSLRAQQSAFSLRRVDCMRLPDMDEPRKVISRGLRRQGT